MHLPCPSVTHLHEVDVDILFGETKSQQGVECETGISDPSESIIPEVSQRPRSSRGTYQFRPPPTCSGSENVGAATIAPVSSNTSIFLSEVSHHPT